MNTNPTNPVPSAVTSSPEITLEMEGQPTGFIPARTVSGLFMSRDLAEKAIEAIERLGYHREHFNVMMSRETHDRDFTGDRLETELGNKALEGAGVGGAVGGAFGAMMAGLAAFGTILALPGLGLILAGPIVAGLVGAGAGGFLGGIIGAFVGAGIPEERVKEFEEGLRGGGILISVVPNTDADGERIAGAWTLLGGINIHA